MGQNVSGVHKRISIKETTEMKVKNTLKRGSTMMKNSLRRGSTMLIGLSKSIRKNATSQQQQDGNKSLSADPPSSSSSTQIIRDIVPNRMVKIHKSYLL